MTIGAFITITNPIKREDPYLECLSCLEDLCDEILIVDGGSTDGSLDTLKKYKISTLDWPYDFDWSELPHHMNLGLNSMHTDWVIRMDVDYQFHHNDIASIKRKLKEFSTSVPIAGFQKHVFVKKDMCFEKGNLPIAINKELMGSRIQFGHATNKLTDLCYPIYWEGKMNKKGIPVGTYNEEYIYKTGLPVYTYDYSFKTKENTKREFWRFAQAYYRYYGEWRFGSTEEESFKVFIDMMKGRAGRCTKTFELKDHPKYIQDKIKNITPEQFIYNMWGNESNS